MRLSDQALERWPFLIAIPAGTVQNFLQEMSMEEWHGHLLRVLRPGEGLLATRQVCRPVTWAHLQEDRAELFWIRRRSGSQGTYTGEFAFSARLCHSPVE